MNRKSKYALKNKKKFFSFLFLLSLILFILIYTASVSGYGEPEYAAVEIKDGDTLWSIAEKYGQDCDIRKYIHNIKKVNNIESDMLYARTIILIPADK